MVEVVVTKLVTPLRTASARCLHLSEHLKSWTLQSHWQCPSWNGTREINPTLSVRPESVPINHYPATFTEGKYHIPWTCSSQGHLELFQPCRCSLLPCVRDAKPIVSSVTLVPYCVMFCYRSDQKVVLPQRGRYATGILFIDQDTDKAAAVQNMFEELAQQANLQVCLLTSALSSLISRQSLVCFVWITSFVTKILVLCLARLCRHYLGTEMLLTQFSLKFV